MESPSILCDSEIEWYAHNEGMISPFVEYNIRMTHGIPGHTSGYASGMLVLSYGLTSFGYDLRLSEKDFRVFKPVNALIDPKNFDESMLVPSVLQRDDTGSYFILPPNSYGLGAAVEKLKMPNNIMALCVGKSTYARVGIIANVTPAEPGWEGHLTLEFSNSSPSPCKMYVNEGVVQMLFFRGSHCDVHYGARHGKYQSQGEEVTLPKV